MFYNCRIAPPFCKILEFLKNSVDPVSSAHLESIDMEFGISKNYFFDFFLNCLAATVAASYFSFDPRMITRKRESDVKCTREEKRSIRSGFIFKND